MLALSIATLSLALWADGVTESPAGSSSNEAIRVALARSTGESFGAASKKDALAEAVLTADLVEVDTPTLLGVILAGSTGKEDPYEVAQRWLSHANGNLSELTRTDLVGDAKVGRIAVARVLAAREIVRRASLQTALSARVQITGPGTALTLLRPLVGDTEEHFAVLYLDRRGQVLRAQRLTMGTTGATMIDVPRIVRIALEVGAKSLVLGHNHPSQDCEPSQEDIRATAAIAGAAAMFGLDVVDHLILTRCGYTSLRERGQITTPSSHKSQPWVSE